ncbi:hemopexin [Brachionichthys hirsutus]|uniref:hemopexin n=1 Tax=Brachionichthys hirsutus TaxID=412623 RepID=UPI0036048EC2
MELFTRALCACLALALTSAAPVDQAAAAADADAPPPNRCDGIEFDAITPDEKGVTFFFKGAYLWEGFHGPARLYNATFKRRDAAFRMHSAGKPDDHDHIYFFVDDKVLSYYGHKLEDGYPKSIQDVFPGIPSHLDAAVECPTGECPADSVLFFKGRDVHVYDIATKTVKTKRWPRVPACTSALRWLEHYYCFHAHTFTRFHPVSGEVNGTYPKDARDYFMSCPGFGHGGDSPPPKCSSIKMDAMTTDDAGKSYMFSGPNYMRLDTHRDGLHAFPITRMWKEVTSGVDAVFSHGDRIYMIKDGQVYIYKTGAHYVLVEGYPKTLEEELGVEGHVDAAFICPGLSRDVVHIIQGGQVLNVNLTATPRVKGHQISIPLSDIDAAHCDDQGIDLFRGSQYHHYQTFGLLSTFKIATLPQRITPSMVGCRD